MENMTPITNSFIYICIYTHTYISFVIFRENDSVTCAINPIYIYITSSCQSQDKNFE